MVALVTAAGGGIGQGAAWLLAERGVSVVATDIVAEALEETRSQSSAPERIHTLVADATTSEGAEASVAAAKTAFGALHILANVVGGSRPGQTVVDMSLEEWERWVRLNLTSTFLMCKAAIPLIAASGGGSIVNISSGAAVTGMNKNPAYVAAKGGVISLTRSLALDHGDQGIRVNCITPGAIMTPLMKRNRKPEEIDYLAKRTLVSRLGLPRDIAATIAFLASEDGSYINGEVINVTGGARAMI
jgi:NAD(P)-dependent dehydrogenase (short-subunit alcohol dehydrogenase family)